MNEKLTNGLLSLAGKMQSNKVLSAIKDSFIDNMPVVIMGSFCTLIQFVVCTHAEGYISLANVPGMEWLVDLTPIFTTANYGCMNFMAVAIVFLVASHYAENIGHAGDRTASSVALACFITLATTEVTTTLTAADAVEQFGGALELGSAADAAEQSITVTISSAVGSSITNSSGLFVALIVGILSTLLYCKLIDSGKLTIKLPDSVPPNVSQSFAVLFPSVVTILIVAIIGFVLSLFGLSFFTLIATIMAPVKAIMTGIWGYEVVVFLIMLFWWFGIHGANVMSAVTTAFLTQTYAENNALYSAGITPGVGVSGVVASGETYTYNIICNTFVSAFFSHTGSGLTGGMIIAVLLFSKRDDYRAICKLAIPCGLFNINEPIIFGIPMVMNPMLAVPFFLAPMASVALGYILTLVGICPIMVVDAPWTTPTGILGFLGTGGNIMGGVSQLLCIALATLIYTPFIIASNNQAPEEAAA